MSRRQALILACIAVALTAFSVALSRRDSRDWRASRSRRLLPFAWRDAARAAITRADGTIRIFRDRDGGGAEQWKLELPEDLSDDLNPNATESLAALATLAWRERVAGREAPVPGGKGAVTLDVTSAAGESVSITLGEVRDGLRSAVVDGDGTAVYGVNQNLVAFLDWPRERFRSMLLAAPGQGARPKRIVLSPAGAGDGAGDDPKRGLTVALEERDEGWFMTEPVEWPVDENRLDILVRWLDRLRAESIAAEMTGDPEYFGFDGRSAFVEAWFDAPEAPGGAVRRRVEFGGAAGDGEGGIYARETGRDPVFTLPKEALAEISLDIAAEHPEAWRNFFRRRGLDRVGIETPSRIVVEKLLPEPAKLTVTHSPDPENPGWTGTLEEGGRTRTFAVDAPDSRDRMLPLTALFTGLASLRARNFLADAAPGPDTARWTAFPAWRYSLFAADGSEMPGLTLYAADASGTLPCGEPYAEGDAEPQALSPPPGAASGAGMAFSIPERAAVMETFAELSYLLCLPPYRYQSRRLVDADMREWTRIVLTVADGEKERTRSYRRDADDVNEQWWREGGEPEPLLDDNNRFVSLLLQLSRLRAEGFAGDVSGDAAKFGLDRPAITAIVYSSPGGGDPHGGESLFFTLAIGGGADARGGRYARLDDDGPVFVVPARIAAALGAEYR